MKRTRREVMKAILEALKDGKEHSFGYLEQKTGSNWKSIRDHCQDLELFNAVDIQDKVKITKEGLEILKKLKI